MMLSVIVCSHNSRLDYLERVLNALREQTLCAEEWELVLVDNASRDPLLNRVDLSWHPAGRVVRNDLPEDQAGLVDARCRGINESRGEIIVFADDDNVLAPDYLSEAIRIAIERPYLGAWGGQISLVYEDPALRLPPELEGLLCHRVLDQAVWSNVHQHYDSTPWGAGLCIRRRVAERYLQRLVEEPDRVRLDPRGREMRFGGDTDLVQAALLLGMGKGVFPSLCLTHLIPARRCDPHFLRRCFEAHGYSATLHGWLDRGRPEKPRSDIRFWVSELLRWPLRSHWSRVRQAAWRRGARRAYNELLGQSPRRVLGNQSCENEKARLA